ncbi:hypothetical protein AB0J25_10770 [Streptomyces sp. NPDC049910]|uniref:hypothetical protein n=1 Tax=Streptomyces sp. NPDC049910 TaxID=3155278 RepID=UPI00342BD92E
MLPQLLTAEAESTSAVVPRSKKVTSPARQSDADGEAGQAPAADADAEGDEPDEGLRPAA